MPASSMIFLNIGISLAIRSAWPLPSLAVTSKPGRDQFLLEVGLGQDVEADLLEPGDDLVAALWPAPSARNRCRTRSPCSPARPWSERRAGRASASRRSAPAPLSVPAWICGSAGASEPEFNCTVSVSTALTASPPPLNTTVAMPLEALAQLQHLGLELRRGADRRRRDVELVRVLLHQRDKLLHVFGRQVGLHREHVRRHHRLADRARSP